ncbi:MAG: SDR family oxidoreductase [Opitutaceae bacterium]|nr:SDR family oxidoreductase [Opitutaceae bacterium]
MSTRLAGKVCLIAGTTGIARASAVLFGSEGASIVAIGRSREHAAELQAELDRAGVPAATQIDDLTSEGAAARTLQCALERFGRVDVLFHVAGISGRSFGDGPLHECTDAGWDAVMTTNVRAMMQLNRACIVHWLAAQRSGTILNMASVLGFSFSIEYFGTVAYAAAKAAIIAMSQNAAATYAKHGIRVNVIAPALVDTPMARRATLDPAILEFLKRKQPLTQKPLTDRDCAEAALYLCSDAAAAVTGIVLPVDGGWCVSG